jgi:hypothetical protein
MASQSHDCAEAATAAHEDAGAGMAASAALPIEQVSSRLTAVAAAAAPEVLVCWIARKDPAAEVCVVQQRPQGAAAASSTAEACLAAEPVLAASRTVQHHAGCGCCVCLCPRCGSHGCLRPTLTSDG